MSLKRSSSALIRAEGSKQNSSYNSAVRAKSPIMEESSQLKTPIKGERVRSQDSQGRDCRESSQQMFTSEENNRRKSPLPFRVATLIKNSSGIQLAYRGAGVLPKLSSRQNLSSCYHANQNPNATARQSINQMQMTQLGQQFVKCKPVSISKNLRDTYEKTVPQENLRLLARLVNAPPSVKTVSTHQKDYVIH